MLAHKVFPGGKDMIGKFRSLAGAPRGNLTIHVVKGTTLVLGTMYNKRPTKKHDQQSVQPRRRALVKLRHTTL